MDTRGLRQIDSQLLEADDYLRKVVECLVNEYRPERIYLFGSQARGQAKLHSDYDLLVIVEKKPSWKERKRVHQVLWRTGLRRAMDIVLFTKKGFETRIDLQSSLPGVISQEGKLLYAA